MPTLGFDQSLTRTGWCYMPGRHGSIEGIRTGSFASEDPRDFMRQCSEMIEVHQPGRIVFEDPIDVIMTFSRKTLPGIPGFSAGNAGQLKLHRIAGQIEGLAFARSIECLPVKIKSWRAAVLGNGNLTGPKAKAQAREWCRRNGITIANHDEAEGVCITYYGATIDRFDRYR